MDQPLVLLVTEKRDRDVLGQIVVPLSNLEDVCSAEPLRVPLQPGLRCPDLFTSPGELTYSVWITETDRSLTSRTTAGLNKLRRKLNSSPTSWNEFRTNRRHSVDSLLDLHAGGASPNFYQISFDEDMLRPTSDDVFMPVSSPEGYVKRSSLQTVSELYFPHPQILEVCPSEGPTTGGTVVTVRGRDLGLGRDDVVGLFICGSDVVDSVQYISSERLVCRTSAWRPCVGSVTVETASGGRASCTAQFTFIAGSEPCAPRIFTHCASDPLDSRIQRRRLSLSMSLDNTRSSWGDEGLRTPRRDSLRRRRSVDVASPPVANIQPTTTSPGVTQPQTFHSQKVTHISFILLCFLLVDISMNSL